MAEEYIQLAHGGGGRLSNELIEREILPRFGEGSLATLPDAASLPAPGSSLVFSTDSFVVQPLEFPGGNIGHLAVHGTVNDVAVAGGQPKWLSLALIIEDGLPMDTLRRILDSIQDAAANCHVQVVTGDTKVVPRGQCDGLYVNTSGIGVAYTGMDLGAHRIQPGDHVLASGNIGDHGAAVMTARNGIQFSKQVASDTAPVIPLVEASLQWAAHVRFMRDPTRGGLAAILNEIASGESFGFLLEEERIPVSTITNAVCEMLGFDVLHLPSEGRLVMVCDPGCSRSILEAWNRLPAGRDACQVGEVTGQAGRVVLETSTGGRRMVDVPRGELLPRIC